MLISIILFVTAVVVLKVFLDARAKKKRYEALVRKYGDARIASRIMEGSIWQEMTEEMVRDSWGPPAAVEVKVLKTKHKEIWKYTQTGKNRFRNRVIIENGIVVGWDIK